MTVVGVGADGWAGLSPAARDAVRAAGVLFGAQRQLDLIPERTGGHRINARRVTWPSPLLPALAGLLAEHGVPVAGSGGADADTCAASGGDHRHLAPRRSSPVSDVCVLASGDPMFHGIGTTLVRLLGADRVRVLSHPSSASLACARLGWAVDGVDVVSAVGLSLAQVHAALAPNRRLLVLSADRATPIALADLLVDRGYGGSPMTVLERLGAADEAQQQATAREWAAAAAIWRAAASSQFPHGSATEPEPGGSTPGGFKAGGSKAGDGLVSGPPDGTDAGVLGWESGTADDLVAPTGSGQGSPVGSTVGPSSDRMVPALRPPADLNVVAVEPRPAPGAAHRPRTPGLPEDAFEHDGQITKREIRAVTLARLGPVPGELLWDVGAGSGSIAIEWMRAHATCRAIAIEPRADRAERIRRNATALGVPALRVVEGRAPQALAGLPAPDAVFVGGGVTTVGLLESCWAALRGRGRLVVNAVTLESEGVLAAWYARWGGDLIRLSVSRASPVGGFTGWRTAMPVTQWTVWPGDHAADGDR
ncbi:bifunctional cobalt-precorrin-7 (C(5))-methyltransferase/cobalt-precorrin-6B (C(15))-methyltransferase [Frankia sp. QA3]|uniref:bifunctional cobalt-precorrin-7 (C(5))-methyltransferase/cobalt-precorrin-6B (C(15))-methyltransferase n=1 Tax=Frankia sp. QA3 TaxID=710111 RepID=UPI0002DF1C7F|nr:bifunctional cobalt-precorrin-7 (C(5))-methyltransferase/cobalt-precorrin-6B (C(15))-methyltransferase [Frankia sp. QA3]